MKIEQTEFRFDQNPPSDPQEQILFNSIIKKYSFDVSSLDTNEFPDKLLEKVLYITRPREGEIDFEQVQSSFSAEVVSHFNEVRAKVVDYVFKRVDILLAGVSSKTEKEGDMEFIVSDPVNQANITFAIEEADKTLKALDVLGQRGLLEGEEITQLENKRALIKEMGVELGLVKNSDKIEA